MKMIIEHFVTFMLLLVFMWVGISYVMQNMIHTSARDYHGAVVSQLENSDYAETVILECEKKAAKNGYKLDIQRYETGYRADAKVVLTYHYTVPIIQVTKEYSIEGYGR